MSNGFSFVGTTFADTGFGEDSKFRDFASFNFEGFGDAAGFGDFEVNAFAKTGGPNQAEVDADLTAEETDGDAGYVATFMVADAPERSFTQATGGGYVSTEGRGGFAGVGGFVKAKEGKFEDDEYFATVESTSTEAIQTQNSESAETSIFAEAGSTYLSQAEFSTYSAADGTDGQGNYFDDAQVFGQTMLLSEGQDFELATANTQFQGFGEHSAVGDIETTTYAGDDFANAFSSGFVEVG